MVPAMDDDFQVTSEPYRLMPPRKRAGSDIGEALDAARVTGPELRQALDAVHGTAPEPAEADGVFWPDPSATHRRLRRLGRTLARVDVWILIVGVVGVVIAYLTLVKPG
jgi:hypothetical protein